MRLLLCNVNRFCGKDDKTLEKKTENMKSIIEKADKFFKENKNGIAIFNEVGAYHYYTYTENQKGKRENLYQKFIKAFGKKPRIESKGDSNDLFYTLAITNESDTTDKSGWQTKENFHNFLKNNNYKKDDKVNYQNRFIEASCNNEKVRLLGLHMPIVHRDFGEYINHNPNCYKCSYKEDCKKRNPCNENSKCDYRHKDACKKLRRKCYTDKSREWGEDLVVCEDFWNYLYKYVESLKDGTSIKCVILVGDFNAYKEGDLCRGNKDKHCDFEKEYEKILGLGFIDITPENEETYVGHTHVDHILIWNKDPQKQDELKKIKKDKYEWKYEWKYDDKCPLSDHALIVTPDLSQYIESGEIKSDNMKEGSENEKS